MPINLNTPYLEVKLSASVVPIELNFPRAKRGCSFCIKQPRTIDPKCPGCHGFHAPLLKAACYAIQSHEVLVCPYCRRRHKPSNNMLAWLEKHQKRVWGWTLKTWRYCFQRKPQSRFLDLPFEIRGMIYQYLFSEERLQCVISKHDSRSRPNRFKPRDPHAKRFAILLTCRQCCNEGLKLYYRYATTINVSKGRFRSVQFSERQNWPEGSTTNMEMVRRYAKRVIETPSTFHFPCGEELVQMKSLEEVIIKLPLQRRDDDLVHHPNLHSSSRPTPPTDEDMAYYHGIALPANFKDLQWQHRLKTRAELGSQTDGEDDWLEFIRLRPRIKVSVQFPTSYWILREIIQEVSTNFPLA